MSVGTETIEPILLDAVNRTIQGFNIPVITAAGNADSDACTNSPARSLYATSVGASNLFDAKADFSNFGKCVNIFAPGTNIRGAGIGCFNCTTVLSGTSQAAPIVAGIVAQLLNENPEMLWSDIIDYWAQSYVRNRTTGARIVQAPPLQRVFAQKFGNAQNPIRAFCSAPTYVPYQP
jgi:subtilisin family serine protease